MANSRARNSYDADGLMKILAEKETDEVLSMRVMSPSAGVLVWHVAPTWMVSIDMRYHMC
jgi:pyruvate/2-oxoglutarate dehydrogenase complex dihydrolipoamide dehydrogenase (E3) component